MNIPPFSFPSGSSYNGVKNRLVNGSMYWDLAKVGGNYTITAAAAGAYTVDNWYAVCNGANVTVARVTSSGTSSGYALQATGAASVTGIIIGQRIAAQDINDLASSTVTLSAKLANSVLTTVTWAAYYPNSTDSYAGGKTQIATGTFTVNSSLATYSASFSTGANITAGMSIELSVGAQTSGTFTVGDVQLEAGSTATSFEIMPQQYHLDRIEYRFSKSQALSVAAGTSFTAGTASLYLGNGIATTYQGATVPFKRQMAKVPTITTYDAAGAAGKIDIYYSSAWHTGQTLYINPTSDGSMTPQISTALSVVYEFEYIADARIY